MYKTRRVTHPSIGCGPASDVASPRLSTPTHRRPIDEIPDSTFRLIFSHCIDYTRCYTGSHPPIVFLRVCRRWRDIARATPELWSTIVPNFANPKLISLFIELSASTPLRLHCGPVLAYADPGLGRRIRDTFEVFLLEVHRWQEISFDLGELQATKLVARLTPNSAPMLTSISLRLDQVPHRLLAPLGKAINLACPNIHSLTLIDPNDDDYILEGFPFDRVSQAGIVGSLDEGDVVRFISLCRVAEAVYVSASGPRTLFDPTTPPMSMPLLRNLHLTTPGDPVPILQSFALSSLKELIIDVDRPYIGNRRSLLSYFEEAELELVRLDLHDATLTFRAKKAIYEAVGMPYDEADLDSGEEDYTKAPMHPAYRTIADL